jgi:hypothetical protein
MSDKPIAVGDLVMVVRYPHKCSSSEAFSGMIFVVNELDDGGVTCDDCGEFIEGPLAGTPTDVGISVRWLKRIDPLIEPESVPTKEEIEA